MWSGASVLGGGVVRDLRPRAGRRMRCVWVVTAGSSIKVNANRGIRSWLKYYQQKHKVQIQASLVGSGYWMISQAYGYTCACTGRMNDRWIDIPGMRYMWYEVMDMWMNTAGFLMLASLYIRWYLSCVVSPSIRALFSPIHSCDQLSPYLHSTISRAIPLILHRGDQRISPLLEDFEARTPLPYIPIRFCSFSLFLYIYIHIAHSVSHICFV